RAHYSSIQYIYWVPISATTSHADILKCELQKIDSELKDYFQPGDAFVLDRSFRDALPLLNDCGIRTFVPGNIQHASKNLMKDFEVAAALINRNASTFPKPRCSDWTGAAGEESLKSLERREAIAERFQNEVHYLNWFVTAVLRSESFFVLLMSVQQSDNMQLMSEPLNQKGVLKDVPKSPLEMIRDADNDAERMNLYPNLDYKGLFNAISQLVDSAPHLQYGIQAFGQAVLQCLGCLMPFLEYDMIDNLPYLVAYCVAVLPASLHQDILHLFTSVRRYGGGERSLAVGWSRNHDGLPTLKQSSTPLPVAGVIDVSEALGGQGRTMRNRVRNLRCPSIRCQTFVLLLAAIRRETFRQEGTSLQILHEHPNQRFFDILHPQQQVSMVCENKILPAMSRQPTQQSTWRRPRAAHASMELNKSPLSVQLPDPIPVEDRQLLGRFFLFRYGVWLMVGLCTPNPDTPDELLGRLLSVILLNSIRHHHTVNMGLHHARELMELKVPVAKILEPDGTTGVDERNLYNFATLKVTDKPRPETVLPVLEWFQTISFLEVKIPLSQLFELFKSSPKENEAADSPNATQKEIENDKPQNLTCCILMLDILLKQELKNTSRPDVLYYLLQCLQVLVLNTDALAEHKGFLFWCQENLLIEKFMDGSPIKSSLPLQTALATALCYLISSMDDISVYVAQRATLYIGTIHDHAIELLLYCLETQFDLVIIDRPMILQSIYQLHNTLSDRRILHWEFFLNRFEALFLEAQINSNKTVDIANLRDCLHAVLGKSDDSVTTVLPKVVDLEEADRETSNLLVFLLMQFLSRMSSIFHAFMANLPQVLDQNYVMGASIAEPTLMVLQKVSEI
ncbi:unnamed protein product, partial [Leptidea sinapis]